MGNVLQLTSVDIPRPKKPRNLPSAHCTLAAIDQRRHRSLCHYNSNHSNNTKVSEEASGRKVNPGDGGEKRPPKPKDKRGKDTATTDDNQEASLVARQEWRLEVLSRKNNHNNNTTKSSHTILTSIATVTPSTAQSESSVFQKWAAMETEAERPQAKRQLSAESSADLLKEVKKTLLRKEERERGQTERAVVKPKPVFKMQPRPLESSNTARARTWRDGSSLNRKLKKELVPSVEVFSKVDAHTINAGKELRSQRIFSVQTITQIITGGAQDQLEKVRAIWIWLCHNIEYDVSGYLGLTDKLCSPARVLETGRGVCCGYSSVCLQMCQEAGIECVEISGHGKGIGYRQGQSYQNTKSSHMWNAVRLGGHWYLLDACWGAGRVDMDNQAFIKRYDDFYFLTDPEVFINSHCPDEAAWQLLAPPVPLEEFERRVLKTSEFYRLGLTLLHPTHFLLITDQGEATVSMSFSKPVDFTYQISQQSGGVTTAISSSSGLLTVARDSMRLRLLPPARGTYPVTVFARRGGSSGTFGWVCSLLVECAEPRPPEQLPENPFLSWGVQTAAAALGVTGCSQGSEAAVLEDGALELTLRTSRPLMMLCELAHQGLDASVAKRCLATQIGADRLTCHVLCPLLGCYRLSVFVRDHARPQDAFRNAGNFLLRCAGGAVNLNQLFPPSLSTSCGPGVRTRDAGLSKFSHAGALVSTQQGKVNITFQSQGDRELHAVLTKEHRKTPGHPLSRHLLFTHTGSKVTVSVALPEAGVYKLGLYAKTPGQQDYNLLCDFVLRNSSDSGWPPFPCTYAGWQRGCVLLEPRGGVLAPGSWVRFRVRVPGALRVSVLGARLADLQLNKSRVWEGEVFTGGDVSQIKLAAGGGGGASTDLAIIMSFDVLSQQNEM